MLRWQRPMIESFSVFDKYGEGLGRYHSTKNVTIQGKIDDVRSFIGDGSASFLPKNSVYPNSVGIIMEGKIVFVTMNILNQEDGRREFTNTNEFVEFAFQKNWSKARGYFNSSFEEEFDIRSKKSWVKNLNEFLFLDTSVGNSISFNKGKGGELIGIDLTDLARHRRYDLRPTKKGFNCLLKDYITINNENSRYKEPILTVR